MAPRQSGAMREVGLLRAAWAFDRRYHGRVNPTSPPLFQALLGPAFERLPGVLRRLHSGDTATWAGEVEVRRGSGWLARLCAWVARLPPSSHGRIEVTIQADAQGEVWQRRFPGHVMRSSLFFDQGWLGERLGPMRFRFRLALDGERLRWSVARVRLLFVPLPVRLFRGVVATESVEHGRYRFDVAATLPLIGLLVHYRGWLDVR